MLRTKTQTKFILLMSLVLLVFLLGIVLMYQLGDEQAELLSHDKMHEKTLAIETLVELFSGPLKTLAFDYSFWDEMVSFVETGDSAWGYENIYTSLQTYQADAAWVFTPSGQTVYSTVAEGTPMLLDDSTLGATVRAASLQQTFSHFFIGSPIGPLEIRTAPIQPSSDNERATPPQGYFAVAKVWDHDFLVELEQAIGAKITISASGTGKSSVRDGEDARPAGTYVFKYRLDGSDGRPVAMLLCTADNPLQQAFLDSERDRIIYLGVFCLAIMAILIVSLHHWVALPLWQVMDGLRTGSEASIERLQQAGIEFEKIGDLIGAFFEQKTVLETEVVERKRAEETIRDREGLLKATLESTGDGILVVGNDGRTTHWNGRFTQMWRIPADVMSVEDDEQVRHYVLNQLVDPDGFLEKVRALYPSSEESFDTLEFLDGRVFDRYSCPLVRDGKVVGRVWSFRDITDQRAAEQAQRRLQESLERAQRMESLGLLAGGVAHDLNNILGPIVGYSELLARDVPADSKIAGRLQKITKSAQEAAAVIQDLLTLARRGRYEMHPVNIAGIINAYLESVGFERLREQHPNVVVNINLPETPKAILGSDVHLGKVVMNLVTNACEAMPDGGTLLIQTEQAYLKSLYGGYQNIEEGDYVTLRVKDTGTGIAPGDIQKIFEPYFSRKKMGRSGSGLGLSIVYSIVKDHHGYYDILSEPGKGTEFILYFPAVERVPVSADTASADLVGGTESVLVVDDRPDQREMAGEIVTSLGYSARIAENGRRAVEIASTAKPDIILLDMIMEPDFDGLDTYREILKMYPGQKAIIVSGFAATGRMQQAMELGAACSVRKPYSVEVLARAIRSELDRSPNLQSTT